MEEKPRHIPRAIVDRFLPGILAKREPDVKQEVVQDEVAQEEISSISILPREGCKHPLGHLNAKWAGIKRSL